MEGKMDSTERPFAQTESAESAARPAVTVAVSETLGETRGARFARQAHRTLLYHTGTRRMFERVRDAVGQVMDPSTLRWIAFSHFEADECGALNYWLQEARDAQAACSANGALVSVDDFAFGKARPPARELAADVLCGY